jgi:membrane fusion protein (multidrug efflux system)
MSTKAKTRTRYRRLRVVYVLFLLTVFLAALYWYLFLNRTISSDDAYVSGNIIPVQALVPGIIVGIDVDNSMIVHAGQPLIEQEQNLSRERMDKAAAALADAVRQMRGHIAQAEQANREIAALQLQRLKLSDDLVRYKEAEAGGAVSNQRVADTQADIAILDKQIQVAKENYSKAKAPIVNTTARNNPLVLQRRADFIESYIQLHRSRLLAPVDGFVANRRAQAGQQVASGQLLLNIIPLTDLWVTANIKESDIAHVRPGQAVAVVNHAYGSATRYHGRVLGIEPAGGSTFSLFPPDNATGNYIHIVERVPVRIGLDADELTRNPLRPGMSVSVDIDTARDDAMPALHSDVTVSSASYSTLIYRHEMDEANAAADAVINAN